MELIDDCNYEAVTLSSYDFSKNIFLIVFFTAHHKKENRIFQQKLIYEFSRTGKNQKNYLLHCRRQ